MGLHHTALLALALGAAAGCVQRAPPPAAPAEDPDPLFIGDPVLPRPKPRAQKRPPWPEGCRCAEFHRPQDGGAQQYVCIDAELLDGGYSPVFDCGNGLPDGGREPPRPRPKMPDAGREYAPFGFPKWGATHAESKLWWPDQEMLWAAEGLNPDVWTHRIDVPFDGQDFTRVTLGFEPGNLASVTFEYESRADARGARAFDALGKRLTLQLGVPRFSERCGRVWRKRRADVTLTPGALRFSDPRHWVDPRPFACPASFEPDGGG